MSVSRFLFFVLCTLCFFGGSLSILKAETLEQAMARAYEGNPDLRAAYQDLQSTYYLVPEAKANFRPNVDINASQTFNRIDNDLAIEAPGFPDGIRLSTQEFLLRLEQPLYRGGRTTAAVSEAEKTVLAQQAVFWQTEQDILLQAVEAYLDLKQAMAILNLREKNVVVLLEQLEATQLRFEVGELTITDVSQAESRLAAALSDQIEAEGIVEQQKAVYEQVIGSVPEEFLLRSEGIIPDLGIDLALSLPDSIGQATDIALSNSPDITLAQYNQNIAKDAADQVFGELLPELNLIGEASRSLEPSPTSERSDRAVLGVNLSVPLYRGGGTRARLQRARRVINQRDIQIQAVERRVRQETIRTWNDMVSAQVRIKAIAAQIEAAKIALEGVKEESLVGNRTVLDVLDAEEELLSANVSLVSAYIEFNRSQFALLHALGTLRPVSLGLNVSPDWDQVSYEKVKDSWLLFE